jgi:hypothetical protein
MNRRSVLSGLAAGCVLASLAPGRLSPTEANERTSWMQGRWGMMVHWIAPGPAPLSGPWIPDLNCAVDQFQLDRFMEQFEEAGASWIIFTIGQNTSYYASPNSYLDRLIGQGHCSKRDLINELIIRVRALHRRSILYLPGEVNAPTSLHDGFEWNPKDQSRFEVKYTDFIREYATRFGSNCDGWWIDGCYDWPQFRLKQRHWSLWVDAMRAGNPLAAIALNDGSFTQSFFDPLTDMQDFISGECNRIAGGAIVLGDANSGRRYIPSSQNIGRPSRQFHLLTPIDCGGLWAHSTPGEFLPPLYSDRELFPLVEKCLEVKGAVTLNVGISQEGVMSKQTISQLSRIKH